MHAVDARNLVVVRKHAKATPAAIPNGLGTECGWHPWMVSTFKESVFTLVLWIGRPFAIQRGILRPANE